MMFFESVFVDTGAWVALADKSDTHHKKASILFPSLLKSYKNLITCNLVFAETYILILNELGHEAALNFIERLNASSRIITIYSNAEIERDAVKILKKFDDQNFSYTDAVSFAIMKREKIKKAFCFDKHFKTAGFLKIP